MEVKSTAEVFGIDDAPGRVAVRALELGLPPEAYPSPKDNYVFQRETLLKLLRWIGPGASRRNLLLLGDAGTGKSSLILQVAARLNIPVFSMACSGKTRFAHMIGGMEFVDGRTQWRDGPLLSAMRHGGIFLANEITRLDSGEQMNLAEVLDDTATITVPDTGEIVRAHAAFRIAGTGNSGGYGDESGAYVGERASSFAFLDRWMKLKVDYLPEDQERALLKAEVPKLSTIIADAMVSLANDVRSGFVARGGSLRTTISTRSLVVWGKECEFYRALKMKEPALEALNDVILNGVPDSDAEVVRELWQKWVNEASA
jgi:cobaltochelatase CobS